MELYQLKTFVAVAKEGHLTRAAQTLNTSQPAVSSHIKALEGELHLILFDRTPKGMALTAAGENLLDRAQKILDSINDIKLQAAKEKSQPQGEIQMGLNIDPGYLKFDKLLSHSLKKYPGLEYHLVQNMSWEALQNVASGKLDCAFVYGLPDNVKLDGFLITSFDVVVAVPFEWREKIEQADWQQIGELPWIMTPEICSFNAIAKQAFEKEKINPLTIAVADEEITIQRLVLAGAGVTLMIKMEAQPLVEDKKLAVWHKDVGKLPLYFVYLRKKEQPPVMKAVIESIKTVWQIE